MTIFEAFVNQFIFDTASWKRNKVEPYTRVTAGKPVRVENFL